jgi:hypothetical protein
VFGHWLVAPAAFGLATFLVAGALVGAAVLAFGLWFFDLG